MKKTPKPKKKLPLNALKPWARLGIKKEKYIKARPWKEAKMSRVKYEKMLLAVPQELIEEIRTESEAQAMIESIFGEELAEEIKGI